MRSAIAALLILLVPLAGCGASSSGGATTPVPVPTESAQREAALDAFGRALFTALQAGDPLRLLADDVELRALCLPEPATRFAALRHAPASAHDVATPEQLRLALGHAEYAGVCLSGSHDGGPTTPEGLRTPGWVLERVLVAGDDLRAGRLAAWVEGTFVLTDRGVVALAIDRVEAPRLRHADLEMGGCDMAVGLGDHKM